MLCLTLSAARAAAQDRLLLEYPSGPVVKSNRMIGIGGAFVGVAEGAHGHLYNPASFASRYPYTADQTVDWDYAFHLLGIGDNQAADLYGPPDGFDRNIYVGGGIDVKIHGVGFGFHLDFGGYFLEATPEDPIETVVTNTAGVIGAGFGVRRLDMLFGINVELHAWDVFYGSSTPAIEFTGIGPHFGMIWQPYLRPYRLGAAFRPPRKTAGRRVENPEVFREVPDAIFRPAEIALGGSYMFWEREYNPWTTWGLPRHEREVDRVKPDVSKRRYVRLAADIVFTTRSPPGTYSMRTFLQNSKIPAGEVLTTSVRLGIESEVIDNWLVLRGGTYYEPTRISPSITRPRLHGTGGLAFRIPFWPIDLRGDLAADGAREYFQYGFGVGFWH